VRALARFEIIERRDAFGDDSGARDPLALGI
jgi:hypothetical protein